MGFDNCETYRADILIYCASRAADWPPPDLPGDRFINRGMPGEATAGSLQRFGQPVSSLAHKDLKKGL